MIAGRRFVVGGHSRGVGKTALAVELIRALRPRPVVSVKVSAHRHGGGELAIEEDTGGHPGTSTGRCLAAGASRAFLCRCPDGRLHEVGALVRVLTAGGYDVVIESNRMAPLVDPHLTLFVMSSQTDDWKASSALCLPRADALVLAPGTAVVPRARWMAERNRRGSVPVLRFDAAWRVPVLARWLGLVVPIGDVSRPAWTAARAGVAASRPLPGT